MEEQKFVSIHLFILIMLIANFIGCSEKAPVSPDGDANIKLLVLYDSTGNHSSISISNAKVIFTSVYGTMVRYTDQNGFLDVKNIPSSDYGISVTAKLDNNNNVVLSGSLENVALKSGVTISDTIYLRPYSSTGIVFNELYCVGPVNGSFFYQDQFIELYNSSDSVRYLDGIQVIRMAQGTGSGAGTDDDNDNDIESVLHISKFPGKPGEKNYPFKPHSFLVLAVDAIDHRNSNNIGIIPGAVDLSHADWEFYNQYSSDTDNLAVPNLINLQPDESRDFFMVMDIGVMILADGRDSVWEDGIDINTILDGAEYESGPQGRKTLDSRVDRGHFVSPPKYSGKSLQRREPGLDSGNGSLDWEIINTPTPGYQ